MEIKLQKISHSDVIPNTQEIFELVAKEREMEQATPKCLEDHPKLLEYEIDIHFYIG